jgi:hypothetical protein
MTTEYVKQTLRENLSRVLIPHVADGLWSIYDNAKTACERNKQTDQTLRTFQNLLTQVPKWNVETLDAEVNRITIASKCDYIDDLLMGVFVSYIRAFASLQQVEDNHVDIPFTRPELSNFVHALYKSAARESWSNAYLFKTFGVSSEEQARNRRDIETMLSSTLNGVIDSFIPWKDISRAYFRARDSPAPVAAAVAAVAPPAVQFTDNEVHEFETDNEESDDEDEERPRLTLGEEIKLEDDEEEDDDKSIDLESKAIETMTLNL